MLKICENWGKVGKSGEKWRKIKKSGKKWESGEKLEKVGFFFYKMAGGGHFGCRAAVPLTVAGFAPMGLRPGCSGLCPERKLVSPAKWRWTHLHS